MSETRRPNAAPSPDDPSQDLGIGDRVLARSQVRFLNPDGSFNVVREGLPFWRSLSLRFSKPSARILYSRGAVIAPYRAGTALMLRVANARSNQLIDVRATVALGWTERVDGKSASRTSYRPEDISWGAKFSDIFIDPGAGRVGIDLRRLHDIEPAG